MEYYSSSKEEVIKDLDTAAQGGLTDTEAVKRLEKYGKNKLEEKKKKSDIQRFFEQFKDVMILILIAAAVISFAVAVAEGEPKEFFEPVLILLIVIINAVMGMLQESRAEKALDALKSMSAPHARVLRGGEERIIDAADIVPGDIIRLEAGDFIPADARLLSSVSLKSEESALTGESVPSEKDAERPVPENAPLGDRSNMIFSGCSITYGTCTAIVTATGMATEMGKIADLLGGESEQQTPLQKKLAELGRYLGILAIAACIIIFAVGLMNGIAVMEIFMTAVSLAVSAIPEGLPVIVTIVLSIGVQRMVKKNALIRRLPAVETLGSASVICSDKTGTLTQNRMTLTRTYIDGADKETEFDAVNAARGENEINTAKAEKAVNVTDAENTEISVNENKPKESRSAFDIGNMTAEDRLLCFASLCCDGSVVIKDGKEQHIGDPTETAIVLAAMKRGMPKEELLKSYPRLLELPFDSDRKLMTTVNDINGKLTVIVKGAVDVMASRCIAGNIEKAKEINESMSASALRVLAVAYKEIAAIPDGAGSTELESGLTFMGLVGMIDPPRAEAKEAVKICRHAGIKPVMITGDHIVTASAIARELGILTEGDKAVTGSELDAMSDTELDANVKNISVYARVSPENKIRIVKAWQRNGQVVSMTGDGVNDAPALKAADIGCAMGITGTDVAKGAADMILTDDNFATIVDAVREGRGIYANIKKVVGFLLGTNIGEVLAVFTAMMLWHKTPLLSMQLLWINLVTDSLPAIALGMEAVESDVMDKKPKPKDEGLFAHGLGIRIVLQGVMFGALSLIAFALGEKETGLLEGGQTMAFMVLALSQVVQSFNMRSEHSLFKIGPFSNANLNRAAALSLIMVLIVLFTPLRVAFGLVTLTPSLYLQAIGLIIVPLIAMEICKAAGLIGNR